MTKDLKFALTAALAGFEFLCGIMSGEQFVYWFMIGLAAGTAWLAFVFLWPFEPVEDDETPEDYGDD